MWPLYRKTLPVIQSFILVFCLVLYFVIKLPIPAIVLTFFVMQFGAFLGAWWGTRLRNKIIAQDDELPLRNKL